MPKELQTLRATLVDFRGFLMTILYIFSMNFRRENIFIFNWLFAYFILN